MKHNAFLLEESSIAALRQLVEGIVEVGIVPSHPMHQGCNSCFLRSQSGRLIQVSPSEHNLEPRFEVFPITVSSVSKDAKVPPMAPFRMLGPLTIQVLETEDWLDASIPISGGYGSNPIMQCQGFPGAAPASATASCRYVGGIKLISSDKVELVIGSLPFPYTLFVSGFTPDDQLDGSDYRVAFTVDRLQTQ